jgi:hypothetical protein
VCTVKEGLSNIWLQECGHDLNEAPLAEFFTLWQMLAVVHLEPECEDALQWAWSDDGMYSSRSAHRSLFIGRSKAPYDCKFFAWIISRDRGWTTDRLEH